MIAKVEPLTTARVLRGPFDYRLAGAMEGIGVGALLVVPFGPQRVLGVVVDVAEHSELAPERLVEPLAALERDVPAELVRLGLWVAEEYCSTPARGLGLVLPPGTGKGSRPRVGTRRALVAALSDAGGDGRGRDGDRRGQAAAADGRRLGKRQLDVLDALSAGPLTVSELVRLSGCSRSAVQALEQRGLLTIGREELRRRPSEHSVGGGDQPARALSGAQAAALDQVLAALDAPAGADRRLLLHGVTGSGKTEVYLRSVAAALERGRSAIVLVPEIALTPQTASRFRERFGAEVAVLHSKLGAGERYDEWVRLRRGEARVCVGPRSAIFAPVAKLGLIVVDEEHDASYKQEGDPRYDARRVAERRAEQSEAALVAGTATPRPESRERLARVALPERVDGRRLPPVELVASRAAPGALHPRTREALEQVRSRGQKAIVLLNRRGWSSFLSCRDCGRAWSCPACDVTLVLHREAGRLCCHHCGHAEAAPAACPDCGSVSVGRHGAGTERLEQELRALVDPLPVLRLDADSTRARESLPTLLARFDAAPAGVLVGTQMVAKGHDFPGVTLGAIIDADATLRFPDFRAEERTFALVAQLAGRSGRGPDGGRVVVQALDPAERSLRHAAEHDAEGFLAGELERRRALRYPPFSHLVRVVCSASEAGPELEAARSVRERVRASVEDGSAAGEVSVLGPAPLFRRKGRERAQIVVKADERRPALAAVRAAVEQTVREWSRRGVHFAVDVDPQ